MAEITSLPDTSAELVHDGDSKAAGVKGDLRVYRLRGSFVSLLLWEGHSLTYVAEQAGHSVATLANHYAGARRHEPRFQLARPAGGRESGRVVGAS